MKIEDMYIGMPVKFMNFSLHGIIAEIWQHEVTVVSYGTPMTTRPEYIEPACCANCQTLPDRAGELGEKDAEITKLKCELDAAKTYVAQARLDMHMAGSYSLTELRAERDRLAETVRFQDEKIRKMSECNKKVTYSPTIGHDQKMSTDEIKAIIGEHRDRWTAKLNISPMQYDNLQRDARIVLELMASYLPLSLTDISDRLGWKMPRVCETMAMLRIAGRVKLEKGEYRLVE